MRTATQCPVLGLTTRTVPAGWDACLGMFPAIVHLVHLLEEVHPMDVPVRRVLLRLIVPPLDAVGDTDDPAGGYPPACDVTKLH